MFPLPLALALRCRVRVLAILVIHRYVGGKLSGNGNKAVVFRVGIRGE